MNTQNSQILRPMKSVLRDKFIALNAYKLATAHPKALQQKKKSHTKGVDSKK